MLKDIFGFAEHQEKATYDFGYILNLAGRKDVAVLDKAAGIAGARIKIEHIHWYIPHYTPSIGQQCILSRQILSKTPTEFRYIERSVSMEEVNNQNFCNFELSSEESMNVPIWIFVGFQQRERQDSKKFEQGDFL